MKKPAGMAKQSTAKRAAAQKAAPGTEAKTEAAPRKPASDEAGKEPRPQPLKRRPSSGGTAAVAVSVLEKELRSAEEQASAYDHATALFHAREFAKAKVLFEAASVGPNPAMCHAACLHVRMCDHRMAKATPEFTTVEDRYNYAVALINRRELDAAEEQLRIAIVQAEAAGHLYYAMALCCGLKGDLDEACRFLKQAIAIEPGNRLTARNDPDFHEMAQNKALRDLLYA
jgi:tetratricopeptide (TPR) repeat protein